MKLTLKLVSLLLVLVTVVSAFAACGGNNDPVDNKGTDDSVATTQAGLPEMNWDNTEYRILGREYSTNMFKNFEVDYKEMPEDVVGVAVWNRNMALLDKYGIDVVGIFEKDPKGKAKTSLESGDDIYSLIICPPEELHPFAMEGYLVDMAKAPYIDLDNEAWNSYANKQITMGGKIYYNTNKFLLQDKHRSWSMFYNRTLARELNIGYLEEEVFAGTWTIDKLIEVAKAGSAETDGIDGMTYEDRWGVDLASSYCFTQLLYGGGFRITEIGSSGSPELVGATDHMMSIIDKVYELILNKDDCFTHDTRPVAADNSREAMDIYFQGRAVIMAEALSELDNMGTIDFEFGILPNPKFNEDQDDYYAIPNLTNGSLFAIPATVEDVDFAGFALEAISEESAETTYYSYIETKCKLQDAYDEDAAKCLDIIFNGIVYDIAFTSNIGGLGKLVWNMVHLPSNNYPKVLDRVKKIVDKELKDIKQTYAEQ